MLFLASNGYRCIAHDRRGHGRSSQPWDGNEMNTYADDLATLMDTLDLKNAVLIGFSAGGGEVARYIGRHGTKRLVKAALISAVPPLMLKTAANPGGCRLRCSTVFALAQLPTGSKFYKDLASGPFFGFNRPRAKVSQGMMTVLAARDACRSQEHLRLHQGVLRDGFLPRTLRGSTCRRLSFTVTTTRLYRSAPAALASSKLVKHATLKVYAGAPHGLTPRIRNNSTRIFCPFLR